jgi:flavin prenyltransferase
MRGHLKAMLVVSELSGIIAPPVPAFYAKPQDLDDMVDHTIGRVLDFFDLDNELVNRWMGARPAGARSRKQKLALISAAGSS